MPKVALLSDVHLERLGEIPEALLAFLGAAARDAPTLVLAGDVAAPADPLYAEFLGRAGAAFRDVVVVAGNHEYYRWPDPRTPPARARIPAELDGLRDASAAEVDSEIAEIASGFANVHFLQRGAVRASGVDFLGCTLWSHPANRRALAPTAERLRFPKCTLEKFRALHARDAGWLDLELPRRRDRRRPPTVVVTHYLPSFALLSRRFADSPFNSMYASDCEDLVARADAWLCGHSHGRALRTIRGCVCAMNPVGYPGEMRSAGVAVVNVGAN